MPFTDPFVANPFPFAVANTLPLANTLYDVTSSLVSGVYTISWSGGGTLNIDFYNGTTLVTSVSGTSPLTVNLAQSVTNYKMWCTVAPISVVLSLSGLSVVPISGTLYTYTASTTPGLVGDAYCLLVGGGGAGATTTGGGGASGGIVGGRINLVGTELLTIGNGGTTSGASGTPTIFGTYTAQGGNGATGQTGGIAVPGGGAGGNGGSTAGGVSINSNTIFVFFTLGTTAGGCGAGVNTSVGSGIGTGGTSNSGVATNGTGHGSGGAGGGAGGANFGQGTSGICYIII